MITSLMEIFWYFDNMTTFAIYSESQNKIFLVMS